MPVRPRAAARLPSDTGPEPIVPRPLIQSHVLDEGLQHRRHEVQRRHAVLTDRRHQPRRIAVRTRLRHHKPRPHDQRPEELPHRDVKAERRLLQHHVVARQPIGVLHPEQTVAQTLVRVARRPSACRSSPRCRSSWPDDRDADRPAAGAPAAAVTGARHAELRPVEQDAADPRRQRQRRRKRALHQHHAQARIRHHVGQPLDRIVRVERQIGAAGLEDAEQPHHHLERALGQTPTSTSGPTPRPCR